MISAKARPLRGDRHDFDALVDLVGDARFVLLGEATHGTHEFYRARAAITRRLIVEKGFNAVAVDAGWPDVYRVNRFVAGEGTDVSAADALGDFQHFPRWMWRNSDVVAFVDWLRGHNERVGSDYRAGFYGLDLYGLHASVAAVLAHLERVDPGVAKQARHQFACFEDFGEDPETSAYTARFQLTPPSELDVVAQLLELQRRRAELLARNGLVGDDPLFEAEQTVRVLKTAEEHYRSMLGGRISGWNLRATHLADTLDALAAHIGRKQPAKIVVWAHNSHIGDARFTEMGKGGELNLGQLVRERHPGQALLVGFTTFTGTMAAASDWGDPVERKQVRPALPDSYENLFHEVPFSRFLLDLGRLDAPNGIARPRLERAIGAVYTPETERVSHYFECELIRQFDAVLHFDETQAVEPLDPDPGWIGGELPDTYPDGT